MRGISGQFIEYILSGSSLQQLCTGCFHLHHHGVALRQVHSAQMVLPVPSRRRGHGRVARLGFTVPTVVLPSRAGRIDGRASRVPGGLDGVEPAWLEALMREPSAENGELRLAAGPTEKEFDRSAMVRDAAGLLCAVAKSAELELTARGNLTREDVASLCDAMDWPGCAFEERRRAGPTNSRAFRVTRMAPRESAMAAIWQSASQIGRSVRRRSEAISA